jgi:hypothetical protein
LPYHTLSSGIDVPVFQVATFSALVLATKAGSDVIYLCSTLASADSDAALHVFGRQVMASFKKRREMYVEGVRFHLETALNRRVQDRAIVLAVYVPYQQLKKAVIDPRTADWVFVPWSDTDLRAYLAAYPDSTALEPAVTGSADWS